MMSEYELADVALYRTTLFWQQGQTALDVLGQLQTTLDRLGNFLIGYLLLAYFVGSKLTRLQVGLLTFLYLAWQARLLLVSHRLLNRLVATELSMEESARNAATEYAATGVHPVMLDSLILVCIAASVYFMWSVRHPKTE
jgi:hypothetical protein